MWPITTPLGCMCVLVSHKIHSGDTKKEEERKVCVSMWCAVCMHMCVIQCVPVVCVWYACMVHVVDVI